MRFSGGSGAVAGSLEEQPATDNTIAVKKSPDTTDRISFGSPTDTSSDR